jgi:pimeloyl-ACP methyl ester carboxylesterase
VNKSMASLGDSTSDSKTVQLKDGRRLGYAEYGDPDSKPCFHFHGWPNSRLDMIRIADVLKKCGVRLISVDRPGMGLSDFQPNREILDWPDDIVELADALEIDRFAVEGISGGGPYSAACAYKIPDRLASATITVGMGPYDVGIDGMNKTNRLIFTMAGKYPRLFDLGIWFAMARKCRDVDSTVRLLSKYKNELPEPDRKLFDDPSVARAMAIPFSEAFRQGSKGPAYEGKLYAKPWGFRLEDISPKVKVYLWHGELDSNVPVAMGRAMAEAIPDCEAAILPNEGHASLLFNRAGEIYSNIAASF